jgi:hypothetical protein
MNTQTIPKQLKPTTQQWRFTFYRELEGMYRHFCDELAQSNLSEPDLADAIETLMRSRSACLSQLVSEAELNTYFTGDSDDN